MHTWQEPLVRQKAARISGRLSPSHPRSMLSATGRLPTGLPPPPHPHTGTVPLGFTRQTPLSLLGPAPQLWGLVCGTLEPCEPQGAHVPCSASAPRPSPWPGPVPTGHPSQLDQGLQGFWGRREQRRGAPARCHQAERGEVAPAPGLPWAFPPPQAKKPGGPSGRPLRKGSWPPSAMA